MAALMHPRIILLLAALTALSAAIGFYVRRGPSVHVTKPVRGPIVQTVVSSGRVLPPAEIRVGALTSSTVREVTVNEGDPVEIGQLLVQLDDGEARAAVKNAEAAVLQARAGRYEVAKLGKPAANAALRRAEVGYAQAKRKHKQEASLFNDGVSTRVAFDDAKTALALAETQREAARLQVKAASSGGSQAIIAAAGVAQAQAQLALVKEQLRRTRIESTVKGVVLARYAEPGDAAVVGSRLLLLSRVGATRLVIEPDERNLALLAMGQPATASAEAFPSKIFLAELQYIAPSVDPQRGTVEVRLAVPDPPDYLRPHMTVSVEIEVGKQANVLVLPRSAIRELAGKKPYVLAVADGRAVRHDVTLGVRGDDRVQVSGIDETLWVVDEETSDVVAGDAVVPREGD